MSLVGTGAIVGAGASIFGSFMGSNGNASQTRAQIQAGRDAQKLYDDKTAEGMASLAMQLYGPQAESVLRARLGRDQFDRIFGRAATNANFTQAQQAQVDEFKRKLALPTAATGGGSRGQLIRAAQGGETYSQAQKDAFQAQLDALTAAAGGQTGITGVLQSGVLQNTGPGLFGRLEGIADDQLKQGQGLVSDYDLDTLRQREAGQGLDRQARQYGKQEALRIKRDSERALAGLNRVTEGRMISGGFGNSTVNTSALAGNTQRAQEGMNDALGRLSDRQIQMLTQIGMQNNGMNAARAGGRTALQSGLLDRNLSLQSAPLQAEMGLLTSPIFNPYVGQNTTQYFPGVSPSGAFGQTVGNSMSAVGGQMLGYAANSFGQGGSNGGTSPSGQYNVDWSYQPGSTQYGSNRPR